MIFLNDNFIDIDALSRQMLMYFNIPLQQFERLDIADDFGILKCYITLKASEMFCPICKRKMIGNGTYKRKVIIPNKAFENMSVYFNIRRYRCNNCKLSISDNYNLAPSKQVMSYSLIQQVMSLLSSSSETFKSCANICGISDNTVIRIFDRHCHIPRTHFPEAMCIDEVYTKNNNFKAKYSCLLYDFHNKTLIDVLPSRRKEYLSYYFSNISTFERNKVKYICMDMYRPYYLIAKRYFKKATICVDSFHVVKHLNDDLNKIRIRITKRYDPTSIEYYLLNKFNYLLFDRGIILNGKPKFNRKLNQYLNYEQILRMILSIDEDLDKGYYLKELYSTFNIEASHQEAKDKLDDIINEFKLADIYEYTEFIRLLNNWHDEIINSFIRYKGKRINNGIAEAINERVSTIIYNTKGIKNNKRRRKRIMYVVNKTEFTLY